MSDAISKLSAWYHAQCVNEWHEDHGLTIDTLDNPGWSLSIDLNGTTFAEKHFQSLQIDRSDDDWIHVRKNGEKFEAFGGPLNLREMIEHFLSWVA